MNNKETIIAKIYDLLLYIIPILGKFPREHKFLLADRIEVSLLQILENTIEAFYSSRDEKGIILKRINISLEKLRYQIRLCFDLKLITMKRYENISKQLNEIGKMIGGWAKSIK